MSKGVLMIVDVATYVVTGLLALAGIRSLMFNPDHDTDEAEKER